MTKNLVSPLPSNVCTGGLSPSYVPLPLLQDIEHLLDREFVVLKYCPREVIEIFAATLSIGEKHPFEYMTLSCFLYNDAFNLFNITMKCGDERLCYAIMQK